MCDIADARSKKAEEGASSASCPAGWLQLEDGLWALRDRLGSLRVIERRADGDYVVFSGHRSQLGEFPSLTVAMSAATAATPAAVA
jgi:hypothetical protein